MLLHGLETAAALQFWHSAGYGLVMVTVLPPFSLPVVRTT